MIAVKHLVKRYGSLCALDDISFEIGQGEVVGLLGPNGAGKSTAMNILTGCLSAGDGTVEIDGIDIGEQPLEAKRKIGYLPEQPPVYGDMTVREYLHFVSELKGSRFPVVPHIREIMTTVKITEVADRLIRNLSKGYRQRVGIAQALVGDPPIVIFDEPTVGLDPKQIIEVRSLIRTLSARHTVLLSTHILAEVQAVCRRVIILDRGRVVADEQTDAVTHMVEDSAQYRISVIGTQKDCLKVLSDAHGVASVTPTGERDGEALVYLVEGKPDTDCRKSLFYACSAASKPILSMTVAGADLETVFLRLTDRAATQGKETKR